MGEYRVKVVRFTNGERFPVLVDSSGAPIFSPTLFAVTELRMRNLASNTIGNALRSLQILVSYLERESVDLNERFGAGEVLKLHEVEALVQACRRPLEAIFDVRDGGRSISSNLTRLEGVRGRLWNEAPTTVNAAVTATRLQCIRDYVRWLAELHLNRCGASLNHRGELRVAVDTLALALEARMPGGGASEVREGLAPDLRQKLREVTRPDSPENPWADDHARRRNALIVDWLYDLGLRRGGVAKRPLLRCGFS